ncbi:hypothetical protein [Microbacterium sp. NPDC091662]|uniref:hypothetical protein n=1 Tax=Microbacterium sp. NPDC091662 TaxID=3364211 RepID=UPI0037F83225
MTAPKPTQKPAPKPRTTAAPKPATKSAPEFKHPTFVAALAAFQAALPDVPAEREMTVEDAGGVLRTLPYADLADIHTVALPALGREGLFFSARPTVIYGAGYGLAYELTHESGEGREGFVPLPNPLTATSDETRLHLQAARRSALVALTGVAPRGVEPVRREAAPKPETTAPAADATPARDFTAEAKAATGDHAALSALWQEARAAGAPVPVLDAIAALGSAAAAAPVDEAADPGNPEDEAASNDPAAEAKS